MKHIEINYKKEEPSYIYKLWREDVFDIDLFNEFLNEFINLVKECKTLSELEFKTYVFKLFSIYKDHALLFNSHHDQRDLYIIKNYELDYYEYLERFGFVFQKFLLSDYSSLLSYEDDIGKLIDGQ